MVGYSIREALNYGRKELAQSGIDQPPLEARILLGHVLNISPEALLAAQEEFLSEENFSAFAKLVARRVQRVPIAHLISIKEFYSLKFEVNENVLIPRPDSEVLIDEALDIFTQSSSRNIKILDLGTGSGCLLLTLLHHLPKASGVGVDSSSKAIEIAQKNCTNLRLGDRAKFLNVNWNQLEIDENFDLIISNPPYIESAAIQDLERDVKDYEPSIALVGGEDGLLCYRQIMPIISKLIADNGVAIIECGQDQHSAIAKIACESRLEIKKYSEDLSGIVRAITLILR